MLGGYVAWFPNRVRSLFLNILLAGRGFPSPTAADDSYYKPFQTNNGYAQKLVALLSVYFVKSNFDKTLIQFH